MIVIDAVISALVAEIRLSVPNVPVIFEQKDKRGDRVKVAADDPVLQVGRVVEPMIVKCYQIVGRKKAGELYLGGAGAGTALLAWKVGRTFERIFRIFYLS